MHNVKVIANTFVRIDFKLEQKPPTITSVSPQKIYVLPGQEKGTITVKGDSLQHIHTVLLKDAKMSCHKKMKILLSSNTLLKFDLGSNISGYVSGAKVTTAHNCWDKSGSGTLEFWWGDTVKFKKINLPPWTFGLYVRTYTKTGVSPYRQKLRRNVIYVPKKTQTRRHVLKSKKDVIKIGFRIPRRKELILKAKSPYTIKWSSDRRLNPIIKYLKINLDILDSKGKKRIGIIAKKVPLRKQSFYWRVGRHSRGSLRPNTKYILRIITTKGVVLDTFPLTILKR